MYCIHCGKKIEDNQDYCMHCGMYQKKTEQQNIAHGANKKLYDSTSKINPIIFIMITLSMIIIGIFSGVAGESIGNIFYYIGFILLLVFGIGWAIKFIIHDIKRTIDGIKHIGKK